MAIHTCTAEAGWQDLADLLRKAAAGDEIYLEAGTYHGTAPLSLPAGIPLIGTDGVLLHQEGEGPILTITSSDCQLSKVGFSSTREGQSCVQITDAKQVLVSECLCDGAGIALTAIFVQRSQQIIIQSCTAKGFQNGIVLVSSHGEVSCSRCHDNKQAGIGFFSSTGRADTNESWGNALEGIVVTRDPTTPESPSDVTLIGNRCHDNKNAGIGFFSSTGRADTNESWDNALDGIVVARSSTTPESPSEVTLIGNRCHDNKQAGIGFFSSTGRAKANECWGNGEGGIVLTRNPTTPESPSEVTLIGNRCHGNKNAGIGFFSSTGQADTNESWGNALDGIVVARSSTTPEHPSVVTLVGNRCHENKQTGIGFFSSTGRAKANECWGNGEGGIAVTRDPTAPESPSEVTLIGNRCHENKQTGIAFISSTGRAKANECWGNALEGIAVARSSTTPEHPSVVTLIGNRCHDNKQAGIGFFSSTGRAKANESWANALHGIVVARNSTTPESSSDVTLIGNRCHENKQTGIVFFSSTGRAKANECWGNALGGIVVARNPTTPEHPSEITLVGNRCNENSEAGIAFFSSTGRAKANQCWGNQDNEVTHLYGSQVVIHNHRTSPGPSPGELRRSRLRLHPLGASFTNPLVINHPSVENLADFLHSGGCPQCFTSFWEQEIKTSLPKEVAPESVAAIPSTDDRIRTYEMTYTSNRSVQIHRATIPPERSEPPRTGLDGLPAALEAFSKKITPGTPTASPLQWTIAFISAQSADESTFVTWLNAVKRHTASFEGRYFDYAQAATSSDTPAGSRIEEQLLSKYSTWWTRLGARAEAFLFMPVQEFLGALAVLSMLSLVTFLMLTFWFDLGHSPAPSSLSTLVESLAHLRERDFDWQDKATMGVLAAIWLLSIQTLINRNLPSGLRLSTKLTEALNEWLLEMKLIKAVLEPLGMTQLFTFLGRFAYSQPSRQFWLLRQIYGYRLFDRFRPGTPAPRLIAFLNVDVLTQQDREDMRLLLERCPRHQPVIAVTQMAGLSMLTGAYIDVWAPRADDSTRCPRTSYIVHDIDAGMIQPPKDSPIVPTDNERQHVLSRLGRLLGWLAPEPPSKTHEPTQVNDTLTQHGNVLTHEKWAFVEITHALVIGSTPYAHMSVDRHDTSALEQYKDEFLSLLAPYLELFEVVAMQIGATVLAESEARVERGDAFLLVKRTRGRSEPRRCWVGRGGYRRELADLVRTWYAYSHKTAAEADEYLAELMLCGEIYHLGRMSALFNSPQSKTDQAELELNHQLGLLHMDAACFLVEERLAIAKNMKEPAVLMKQWDSFVMNVLGTKCPPTLSPSQRGRLCSMFLKVTEMYRQNSREQFGFQEEQALDRIFSKPFEPRTTLPTLWSAFLNDMVKFLQQQAHRETAVADQVLMAQLQQEWYALPDPIKQKLKAKSAEFPRDWLDQMGQCTSAESLLDLVRPLREQAALVVGGLSRLAAAHFHRTPSNSNPSWSLGQVADTVLKLRRAAGTAAPSATLVPYTRSPLPEACAAATTLLCEERYLQELCTLLEAGAQSRGNILQAAEAASCAIEGIALGTHGSLYKALELAKDADEVTMKGKSPPPAPRRRVV